MTPVLIADLHVDLARPLCPQHVVVGRFHVVNDGDGLVLHVRPLRLDVQAGHVDAAFPLAEVADFLLKRDAVVVIRVKVSEGIGQSGRIVNRNMQTLVAAAGMKNRLS